MDIGSGPFASLAQAIVTLIVQVAGAAVMVILAWKFLGILFSGGSERALRSLAVSLVVIGVCVAGLSNLSVTLAIVTAIGRVIWESVATSLRVSLGGGA